MEILFLSSEIREALPPAVRKMSLRLLQNEVLSQKWWMVNKGLDANILSCD